MPLINKSKIRDVKFGKNVKIIEPVNLYEYEVEDNSFVRLFIDKTKEVKIGSNTRISSYSFLCELAIIGSNFSIGHGVTFISDLFKEGKLGEKKEKRFSSKIGKNVLIGVNTTILPVNV